MYLINQSFYLSLFLSGDSIGTVNYCKTLCLYVAPLTFLSKDIQPPECLFEFILALLDSFFFQKLSLAPTPCFLEIYVFSLVHLLRSPSNFFWSTSFSDLLSFFWKEKSFLTPNKSLKNFCLKDGFGYKQNSFKLEHFYHY